MYVRLLLGLLCVLGCAKFADASPFAYVANYNGNSVTVIDMNCAGNTICKIKDIPLQEGQHPFGVAVNKFGSRVYVSNRTGTKISVIDTADDSLSTFDAGFKSSGLAVSPAGTRLYVARPDSASLAVLNAVNGAYITATATGSGPKGVVVNSAGDRIYVANESSGTISVFSTDENDDLQPVTTITVDAAPTGLALNPAGTKLYVSCANSGTINVIDTTGANMNTVTATITGVGSMPFGLAVKPDDGSELYVTLGGSGSESAPSGKVQVIRTSDNEKVRTIDVGAAPMGIAVTPGGAGKVLVANSLGRTVSVFDGGGSSVHTTVNDTGDYPISLGNFAGPRLFPITFNPMFHGTVTPTDPITVLATEEGDVAQAPEGQPFRLTVTPALNHDVNSVVAGGITLSFPYTIPNVTDSLTVSATFTRTAYTIYVTKDDNGNGGTGRVYITSPAPGLDCPADCQEEDAAFPLNQYVTLNATASSDSDFLGWSGSNCSKSYCQVITDGFNVNPLDGEYHVTAVFRKKDGPTTLKAQYDATPNLSATPISANAAYTENFNADASKTVTITPGSPSTTLTPANAGAPTFVVSLGTIIIKGGGTLIIK